MHNLYESKPKPATKEKKIISTNHFEVLLFTSSKPESLLEKFMALDIRKGQILF